MHQNISSCHYNDSCYVNKQSQFERAFVEGLHLKLAIDRTREVLDRFAFVSGGWGQSQDEVGLDLLESKVQSRYVFHLQIHVLFNYYSAKNVINLDALQLIGIQLINLKLNYLHQINKWVDLKVDVDFPISVLAIKENDTAIYCVEYLGVLNSYVIFIIG